MRRGYVCSAVVLILDFCAFLWGGALIGIAAVLYAFLLGEGIARKKEGAVLCNPICGRKHQKLMDCYLRVKNKAETVDGQQLENVRVYIIPGNDMNAYCFGRTSIGVTEGALNLDAQAVEALLAHELGHLIHGDAVLNMVLAANLMGIAAGMLVFQFMLMAVIYGFLLLSYLAGAMRMTFFSCFVTNKVTGMIKRVCEFFQNSVLYICNAMICAVGRKGEFQADEYACTLGYAFHLKRFLERYAQEDGREAASFTDILYRTHPATAQRINRLNLYRQQRRLEEPYG